MTKDELTLILRQLGIDPEQIVFRGEHQAQISCPLSKWLHESRSDSHPSLSIKYGVAGEWTVFKCWACKEQGRLWNLVDSYAGFAERPDLTEMALKLLEYDKPSLKSRFEAMEASLDEWVLNPKVSKPVVLDRSVLHRHREAWTVPFAREYLIERDVTQSISELWELRYDHHQERIVFPVYNGKSQLVGAVGRSISGKEPRYYNYFGFNAGGTVGGLHRCQGFPRVLVVEGFFDILRGHRWAWELESDIVCTWHAEMTQQQADIILGLDKSVQVWYDQDEAGRTGWTKARDLLKHSGFGLKRARWEDNELDVGAMTKGQFFDVFNSMRGVI